MSLGYPCCGSLVTDVHAPDCPNAVPEPTLARGEREEMPKRRFLETHVFLFDDGVRDYEFAIGLGRRDDDTVGELFLNIGKDGALLCVMSHDSAVLVSLLLQYGCPRDVIRGAIMRNPNGTAAGPVGAALDLIERLETERTGAPIADRAGEG